MKYAMLIVLTFSSLAFSQDKTEVCSTKPDATGMTGCEQAVIESYQLKSQLIQTQSSMLQQQYSAIQEAMAKTIALIQEKHPGMVYNPPSSQFPLGSLTKPPAAPSKK